MTNSEKNVKVLKELKVEVWIRHILLHSLKITNSACGKYLLIIVFVKVPAIP